MTTSLGAEEVLSTRPVVIAPRRIETETQLPAGTKRTTKQKVVEKAEPVTEPDEKDTPITIEPKNVVMKVSFRPGSIQLSRPIRKQLKDLGFKPGQKIRITGFGEADVKNSNRLANLRARVVASFLNEAVGDIDAKIQWRGKPDATYAEGAVIETID